MKLLNPLFDTVFKYLMEDIEVAKTLISAIIKKEINELYPAPQESSGTKLKIKYAQLEIYRQDYVAIVKSVSDKGDEKYEKIVIEVQKSPFIPEIGRFRNYLADKYRKKSSIPENDGSTEAYLPIKTIYLVEEIFNNDLPAVLGRRGHYYDELENKEYKGKQDNVVELFAHDTWFIQTEKLPLEFKDELMYILSIFAPSFRKNSYDRFIEIPDNDLLIKKHRILERIIRRLEAATQDNEINTAVDIEIGYEDYILKNIKAKEQAELRADNERKQKEAAELRAEDERKQKEDERNQKEEAELRAEDERKQKETAELRAEDERKQKEEAELKVRILKLLMRGITIEDIAKQENIPVEMVKKIKDE